MLGNILRLIRIANDHSIKKVAEKTGVSSAYVCEIEKGKKTPSLKILKKYAKVYGIKVSKIITLAELQETNNLSNNQILIFILEFYVNGKDIVFPNSNNSNQSNHIDKESKIYIKEYTKQ